MLETERLVLSRVTFEDVDDLVALNEDAEVQRFIPNSAEFDRDRAIELVRGDEQEWTRGRRLFIVRERDGGGFVGRITVFDWPQFGESEVGWVLAPGTRGHGYATEAGKATQEWAFANLQVPYVIALIRPLNGPSIAVAERLEMTPLRSDELNGVPLTVYAIDRETALAR
jgi:RimJ/RimL family protein N-acetyltransferase